MKAKAKVQYDISLTMDKEEVLDVVRIITDVFVEYTKRGVNPEQLKPLLSLKDNIIIATRNASR